MYSGRSKKMELPVLCDSALFFLLLLLASHILICDFFPILSRPSPTMLFILRDFEGGIVIIRQIILFHFFAPVFASRVLSTSGVSHTFFKRYQENLVKRVKNKWKVFTFNAIQKTNARASVQFL